MSMYCLVERCILKGSCIKSVVASCPQCKCLFHSHCFTILILNDFVFQTVLRAYFTLTSTCYQPLALFLHCIVT